MTKTKDVATMALLLDFYGELLTERQREFFDLYHNGDLSLAEIAADADISRQGVRDILVRAEELLLGYEQKLGLVERFCRPWVSDVIAQCGAILAMPDDKREVAYRAEKIIEIVREHAHGV
ncbi:MAG: YlxM family DNA-binding protein [Oscillospiraceae bacterium]|jgi:predicted DNA-binding protein YlxM (UPF0122 family)|nr:YlxM family DNA-binding protein [Oscillospiraceae bacterium]